MNIETEKILIINEIKNIREEWVVKAIKKTLDIDYEAEVNEAHQQVLNERIAFYEANPSEVLDWEKVKKELLNK